MATQYNQVLVNDIDIIDTYKKLMEASTGQNSAYLRAKETLVDMYKNTSMTDKAKADIIAQTISSISTSITNQAMEMAYKLETGKRDAVYALTKLKEDTRFVTAQVLKIEADIANATADKDLKVMTGWKAQAELYRDYGVSSWNYGALPTILPTGAYTSYGIKVETIKMSQANVYNGYATAYRQNGVVLPVIDASTGWLTNATTGDYTGLSYWQAKVSERQKQGFDDNMRQHVANSSATMVSMLLSSEEAALIDDASTALTKWTSAVDYLNTSIGKPAGSILISTSSALSLSLGMSVSGTTLGISAGSTVVFRLVKINGAVGSPGALDDVMLALVQLDGSWSTTIGASILSTLTLGDSYSIEARIVDQSGITRVNNVTKTVVA